MTQVFTLAHISDLHLTPIVGFTPRHWNVKRGLGFLNYMRRRRRIHSSAVATRLAADIWAQGADHATVTGDIANIGLPGEYVEARRWLESMGPPDRVSAIPGNHDIYTTLRGRSCLEEWDAYLASDAWGRTISGTPAQGFPYLRRVGPLALIGLNSAVPTRPLVHSGRLGEAQLQALDRMLAALSSAGLFRVVMIHHPPLPGQTAPRRGLTDGDALAAVLAARGADLVLHGHNHVDSLVWHPAQGGAIPIVGVASGSAAEAIGHEPLARYNLFRFGSKANGQPIEMVTRGLAAAGGAIIEVNRRHLAPD